MFTVLLECELKPLGQSSNEIKHIIFPKHHMQLSAANIS